MRPDRQREQYRWLNVFRVGVKVRDFIHALLTGAGLHARMNSAGHVSPTRVYEETAFRYLVDSEFRRSQRSGHCCQILLVYGADAQGEVLLMEPAVAKVVVAVLSRTLRDTDYIGWYRDGKVVGGVLTLLGKDSAVDGSMRLLTNLATIFQSELGQEDCHPVQVRLYAQHELSSLKLS